MSRTFVLGDVHGCYAELDSLLDRLAVTRDDRLVFAGDLVDKGPDSARVVRYVHELAHNLRVDVCMGNHEENHIRWLGKPDNRKPDMKRHEEFVEIHKGLSEEHHEFLRNTVLYVEVPGGVVTHAGIPEYLKQLPALDTNYENLPRKIRDMAKTMCRLRYVDVDGRFVNLYATDPAIHHFWATRYDGRFGTVFFGHQPYMQTSPEVFPHAVGIDLGCVFGGYLCAIELGPENAVWEQATVHLEKARSKYAPLLGEE